MGLFGKKEKVPCPICGEEVKGLFKTKIDGGQELCQTCAHSISMPKETIKKADVDFIKRHFAYREEQATLFATMNFTHKFTFNGFLDVYADDEKQLLAIGYRDMNCQKNPIVLRYDQLTGYELYLEKKKLDDDKTEGPTNTKTFLSVAGNLLVSSGRDASFTLRLKTEDPYWPEMEIGCTVPYHLNFKGYNDNMNGIGQLLKCIVRKQPFVMEE